MSDFNRDILENMGIGKQEAQSRERAREESSFKFGGEGIERAINMQERAMSNFMGSELHSEEEHQRNEQAEKRGKENFEVLYDQGPLERLENMRSTSSGGEKSAGQELGG